MMELKDALAKHIKFTTGVCVPTCPACAQRQLVEWLENNFHIKTRRDTFGSPIYIEISGGAREWQALRRELGLEGEGEYCLEDHRR